MSGFQGFRNLLGNRQRLVDWNRPPLVAISLGRSFNQLQNERLLALGLWDKLRSLELLGRLDPVQDDVDLRPCCPSSAVTLRSSIERRSVTSAPVLTDRPHSCGFVPGRGDHVCAIRAERGALDPPGVTCQHDRVPDAVRPPHSRCALIESGSL